MVLLKEAVLAADGQIDITAIPATSTHLWIIGSFFRAGASIISDNVNLQFNGDAAANYDMQSMRDVNAVLGGVQAQGATNARWAQFLHTAPLFANQTAIGQLWIPYYSRTDRFKEWFGLAGWDDPAAGSGRVTNNVGHWRSTAAINRVTVLGDAGLTNFGPGTRVSVYGLT